MGQCKSYYNFRLADMEQIDGINSYRHRLEFWERNDANITQSLNCSVDVNMFQQQQKA